MMLHDSLAKSSAGRKLTQHPLLSSPISLLSSIVLLIVSLFFVWLYLTTPSAVEVSRETRPQPSATPVPSQSKPSIEQHYIVQTGDTLWRIAENVYGDGFAWTVIAAANDLDQTAGSSPLIQVGQQLSIPLSAATTSEVVPSQRDQSLQYTVRPGDTLWSIAEHHYGQGQLWPLIYQHPDNRLSMLEPDKPLIHAGNVLTLPPG